MSTCVCLCQETHRPAHTLHITHTHKHTQTHTHKHTHTHTHTHITHTHTHTHTHTRTHTHTHTHREVWQSTWKVCILGQACHSSWANSPPKWPHPPPPYTPTGPPPRFENLKLTNFRQVIGVSKNK